MMLTYAVIGIIVIAIQLIFLIAILRHVRKQMAFITWFLIDWAGKNGFYESDVREWSEKSGLKGKTL